MAFHPTFALALNLVCMKDDTGLVKSTIGFFLFACFNGRTIVCIHVCISSVYLCVYFTIINKPNAVDLY